MQDTLGKATGGRQSVQINGDAYLVAPLTLQDIGTLRNECARTLDPFKPLMGKLEHMPLELQKHAWDEAQKRFDAIQKDGVPDAEMARWLMSEDGVCTVFWLSLRRASGDQMGREQCFELVSNSPPVDVAEGVAVIMQISGLMAAPQNPTDGATPMEKTPQINSPQAREMTSSTQS